MKIYRYLLRRRHVRSIVMFILIIALIFPVCSVRVFAGEKDGIQPQKIQSEGGRESNPPQYAYSGEGIRENPYVIADAKDLAMLAELVSSGSSCAGVYFAMSGDINLNSLNSLDGGWKPIGSKSSPFCGAFDGTGHKISGLAVDTYSMYQGLFGYLGQGAVVKNLTIENSKIRGGSFTGACAGGAGEGSLIQNVVSSADVTGGSNVGGIVGASWGTVEKSRNHGTVSGQFSVGGIAGLGSVLREVENTGSVSAYAHKAGGITGELHRSVSDAGNSGTVTAGNFCAGGIAGSAAGDSVRIEAAWNTGNISGVSYIGGIASLGRNILITLCFNNGGVSGKYSLGGIIGKMNKSEVLNCYNTGGVNGGEAAGGIAGSIVVSGNIKNVYSVGAVQGEGNTGGIAGTAAGNSVQVTNSYYLEGTAGGPLGSGGENVGGSTAVLADREMKLAHERLGAAFRADDQNSPVNGGYPILLGIDYGRKPEPAKSGGSSGASWSGGGSGTERQPYVLDSPDSLAVLAEEPDAHFKLSGDIDLKNTDWKPVERFTGSLDGAGYEIKNLALATEQNDCGLFQQVDGAVIKNITISGGYVSGKMGAGMLAGSVENAVIENCTLTGSISSGEEAVGGLVGEAYNTVIRNVTISADVEGDYLVGGLAGYAANCEIEGIMVTGQVSGRNGAAGAEVGGILGMKTGGTLERSGVTGKVTGPGKTGGLVGADLSGQKGWIKNCFVLGDVTGEKAGGLTGEVLSGSAVNISNCYFAGTLTDRLGTYDNIIPEGSASCYFDKTKNPGSAALQQIFARSTQQLQMKSTYSGWDFVTIWTIVDNQSYPGLR